MVRKAARRRRERKKDRKERISEDKQEIGYKKGKKERTNDKGRKLQPQEIELASNSSLSKEQLWALMFKVS